MYCKYTSTLFHPYIIILSLAVYSCRRGFTARGIFAPEFVIVLVSEYPCGMGHLEAGHRTAGRLIAVRSGQSCARNSLRWFTRRIRARRVRARRVRARWRRPGDGDPTAAVVTLWIRGGGGDPAAAVAAAVDTRRTQVTGKTMCKFIQKWGLSYRCTASTTPHTR